MTATQGHLHLHSFPSLPLSDKHLIGTLGLTLSTFCSYRINFFYISSFPLSWIVTINLQIHSANSIKKDPFHLQFLQLISHIFSLSYRKTTTIKKKLKEFLCLPSCLLILYSHCNSLSIKLCSLSKDLLFGRIIFLALIEWWLWILLLQPLSTLMQLTTLFLLNHFFL